MMILFVGLLVTTAALPTWRLAIRDEANKRVQEVATPHGKRVDFVAGHWHCELVSYTEDPDPEGGRFTLTRYDAYLSCKHPVGTDEAVVLASAASCASVEVEPKVAPDVQEFARTLVQRSYGRLYVTLGRAATYVHAGTEFFTITGGCFRPGLPDPPLVPPPSKAPNTALRIP